MEMTISYIVDTILLSEYSVGYVYSGGLVSDCLTSHYLSDSSFYTCLFGEVLLLDPIERAKANPTRRSYTVTVFRHSCHLLVKVGSCLFNYIAYDSDHSNKV